MLRLGDVVSRHGAIPPTAADQAVATVRRFRHAGRRRRRRRDPGQGDERDPARRRTAARSSTASRTRPASRVEVIGGHEEARLIFGAVRASVVLDPAPAAVLRPRRRQPRGDGRRRAAACMWATSVPLGVARLTAELVHSDPISKRDRRALRDRIVDELGAGRAARSRRSSPSSRSGAAARSRASRRWSRPAATRTRRRR